MHCACACGRPSGLSALPQLCQSAADATHLFLSDCQVSSSTYHSCKYDLRMHLTAFQCIERPNTNLLDCISDTVSSWIQAFHQALHISALFWEVYLRLDLPRNQVGDVGQT